MKLTTKHELQGGYDNIIYTAFSSMPTKELEKLLELTWHATFQQQGEVMRLMAERVIALRKECSEPVTS